MYSKKAHTCYLKKLPKKRVGVNVIFVDAQDRILVVKPSYRRRWLLPGGVVEKNESPLEGGIREVAEELELTLSMLQFLGVDYIRTPDGRDENFQFAQTPATLFSSVNGTQTGVYGKRKNCLLLPIEKDYQFTVVLCFLRENVLEYCRRHVFHRIFWYFAFLERAWNSTAEYPFVRLSVHPLVF